MSGSSRLCLMRIEAFARHTYLNIHHEILALGIPTHADAYDHATHVIVSSIKPTMIFS